MNIRLPLIRQLSRQCTQESCIRGLAVVHMCIRPSRASSQYRRFRTVALFVALRAHGLGLLMQTTGE
jgi:hypothetical protein